MLPGRARAKARFHILLHSSDDAAEALSPHGRDRLIAALSDEEWSDITIVSATWAGMDESGFTDQLRVVAEAVPRRLRAHRALAQWQRNDPTARHGVYWWDFRRIERDD